MVKNKLLFVLIAIMVLTSLSVNSYIEIGKNGIMESMETYVELINTLISLIALTVAISLLPRLSALGDSIKKSILFLIISLSIFVALEIANALTLINVFTWYGLQDIIELFFVIALLIAIFSFKKFLDEIKVLKENFGSGRKK